MEDFIDFKSDNYELEGLIDITNNEKGVVVTHPHPQYGGDMYNYVVKSIVNVYQKMGVTTLRFNFRGVGNSRGSYDNGIGEQKDVSSAVTYLLENGIKNVDLAGYSFGAWVNALAVSNDLWVKNMIMVSPPVDFLDFNQVSSIKSLKLVITGSDDGFAPPDLINRKLSLWSKNAHLEIIQGADHFYEGYVKQLEAVLSASLLK